MSIPTPGFDPEAYVDVLAKKYDALVKHAWVFIPAPLAWLKNLVAPYPQPTRSNIGYKYLHWTLRFYAPLRAASLSSLLQKIIWPPLLALWFISIFISTLRGITYHAFSYDPLVTTAVPEILGWAIILAHVGLLPAAFYRWYHLFTFTTWPRWAQMISGICSLAAALLIFSTYSNWLPGLVGWPQLAMPLEHIGQTLVTNPWQAVWNIALVFPAVTFLVLGVLDLTVWFSWFLGALFIAIVVFHLPFSPKQTHKTAFETVTTETDDLSFTLAMLPAHEIQTIFELAKANLEGVEKRFWPTVIILGALQLFGVSGLVQLWQTVVGVAQGMTFLPRLNEALLGTLWGAIILLTLITLSTLFELLASLMAQSFIINACILINAARQTEQSVLKSELATQTPPQGFFTRFGQWLDAMPRPRRK